MTLRAIESASTGPVRGTDLPSALRNEMARLKGAGFPLLPLGGGADGKSPLTKTWASNLSLAQILAPMHRSGSRVYGVRLDGLAVIDCDTDDPALIADLEARFGPSPVHVRTPRGFHLYYQARGLPPNLRREGLPVDIKTGPRNYAVGPHSERADGGLYVPAKGFLAIDPLPPLKTVGEPLRAAGALPIGHRHTALAKEAMKMVEHVDSCSELFENLRGLRDDFCADPDSFPDSELDGIAGWAWKMRLKGCIFQGKDSAFRLNRLAVVALQGRPGGSDALALYATLMSAHGHVPGLRFPLNFEAMRRAGLTDLTVPRLRAARRLLEETELLRLAARHQAGKSPQLYVLLRPRLGLDAENVVVLQFAPPP